MSALGNVTGKITTLYLRLKRFDVRWEWTAAVPSDSGSGNGSQDPVLRERDQEPSRKQSVQRLPAHAAGDRGSAQRIRQVRVTASWWTAANTDYYMHVHNNTRRKLTQQWDIDVKTPFIFSIRELIFKDNW